MSRNWKKAHDLEKAARQVTASALWELQESFDLTMQSRISLEDKLNKALTLALGAAENLEAQGKSASATALRNAVDVLNPNVSK